MKKLDSLEIMPTRIRIASILRKAILSGEFKEGEELSLTDIANNLGVSRTPAVSYTHLTLPTILLV